MKAPRALSLPVMLAATAAIVALPFAATAFAMRPQSETATANSWAAVAAADGVRVQAIVDDFLVVSNIVDAGGPSAQAVVNAFGDSRGYAAFPYPGEIVLTAHGLSQGAAPKYPLIAQSDPTQPKSDVAAGPYNLHAQSADDSSSAIAQASAGGSQFAAGTTRSAAVARHDPDTGAVTADAETTAEGISVAGVLSIGRVHSHAVMTAAPGKPAQRTSDTEVGDVTVAGQEVGLTDRGLVLAGTKTPLPPDSTANAALSAAGITVHYLSPVRTPTSTVAPGVSVSVVQDVPGVGQTTVTYAVGQATATAQATGASSTSTSTVTGVSSGGPSFGSPPAERSSTSGTSGSVGSSTSGQVGDASPPQAAPVTAGAPPPAGGYALATSTGPSSESFYLVIAAGAVVMAAAAQLFRILAVKLSWT